MTRKKISILGVTGSIGQSTVDIILSAPNQFEVCTITANENVDKLAQIARDLNVQYAVIGNAEHKNALECALKGTKTKTAAGQSALREAIKPNTDITIAGISGIAGLAPLLHAIKNSKSVAIANKEPLVAAGALVMKMAKDHNCTLLPIDSEHNAIFQVFDPVQKSNIERIILTASGGPFLYWSAKDIATATPEQAVNHPNWDMGAKISVDSASMMNKALEVIEAHILFDMSPNQIDVIIHPQSVVHSMVEYNDGSILAQMGASDMRTPIAYALAYPDRMKTPGKRLDLTALMQLNFQPPDLDKFPALAIAYECLNKGAPACLTLNAANEVAVDAFLNKAIDFPAIIDIIIYALEDIPQYDPFDLISIESADNTVKTRAQNYINNITQQQHQKRKP